MPHLLAVTSGDREAPMFAAIYCRVSTAGQAENGTSLDSQRDACLRLAAVRGGAIWSVGAGTDVGGGTVLPGT